MNIKRRRDSDDGWYVPSKRHHPIPPGTLGGDTLTYNLAVERRAREIVYEDHLYMLQTLLTFRQSCADILARCLHSTHVGTFMAPADDIIRHLQRVLSPVAVASASQMSLVDLNKKLKF